MRAYVTPRTSNSRKTRGASRTGWPRRSHRALRTHRTRWSRRTNRALRADITTRARWLAQLEALLVPAKNPVPAKKRTAAKKPAPPKKRALAKKR